MALNWISVLQLVPWSDVIANAPKIAEKARALWGSVARKPVEEPARAEPAPRITRAPDAQVLAELEARLDATEGALVEVHQQLLDSTELINTLAAQNAQLIQRIEANRVRVRWLTAATVVLGLLALAGLATRLFGGG